MDKKRVLFVTQEMDPYTDLTEISKIVRKLPQFTQENGMEIRVLMPRFGMINERRHRLHEVVRLSGMNIIVDDDDFPLIIKVASLPGARIQVYFLDNDEFFKRKYIFEDDKGAPFDDNQGVVRPIPPTHPIHPTPPPCTVHPESIPNPSRPARLPRRARSARVRARAKRGGGCSRACRRVWSLQCCR